MNTYVVCDQGCRVAAVDICPDHGGMCTSCCAHAKAWLAEVKWDGWEAILAEMTCNCREAS